MVLYWAAVLAISTLLYVLLDGLDLGVGIISGGAGSDARRDAMMNAIAPVWDGDETWLVVTGVVLWSAFPIVYATLLSAFYLPLVLMLAGVILRGVAFEYRYRTERWRRLWDASFAGGSFVAAFMQGLTVGRLVEGLPIANGYYVGGDLGWVSPSRRSAAPACASAIRCSEHAGSSGSATATSAILPIGLSHPCRSRCSCFWSRCSALRSSSISRS